MSRILVDMDGVLADFMRSVFDQCGGGRSILKPGRWDVWNSLALTEEEFWSLNRGHAFWESIKPTPEMQRIMSVLQPYAGQVWLFSCPSDDPGSWSGKYAWVEKHLPEYKGRLLLCRNKMEFVNPFDVVIDDSDANIEQAEKQGAAAIPIPRIWNKWHRLCKPDGSLLDGCWSRIRFSISTMIRDAESRSELRLLESNKELKRNLQMLDSLIVPTGHVSCQPMAGDSEAIKAPPEQQQTQASHEGKKLGSHYRHGKIECIEAMEECLSPQEFAGAMKFNVFKYLWRSEHKGQRDSDLAKAQWYLNQLIRRNGGFSKSSEEGETK